MIGIDASELFNSKALKILLANFNEQFTYVVNMDAYMFKGDENATLAEVWEKMPRAHKDELCILLKPIEKYSGIHIGVLALTGLNEIVTTIIDETKERRARELAYLNQAKQSSALNSQAYQHVLYGNGFGSSSTFGVGIGGGAGGSGAVGSTTVGTMYGLANTPSAVNIPVVQNVTGHPVAQNVTGHSGKIRTFFGRA